jgi:hypothetical protein
MGHPDLFFREEKHRSLSMSDNSRGIVDLVRKETLLAMNRSVERMNAHILAHCPDDDRKDAILSEQILQINLWKRFEMLRES